MIRELSTEEAAIKIMDDNLKSIDETFLAGELSSEEYIRAKALVIANSIGCEFEVAMMMATCL